MAISREEVLKVGLLARVHLAEEEVEPFTVQLSRILDYFGKLQAEDTEGVEPLAHALPIRNVLRDDEPGESLGPEVATAGAADSDGKCFRVPRVIDEGASA